MKYNLSSKCMWLIVFFATLTFLNRLNAQSFSNNSTTSITDNGTTSVPIVVSGLPTVIDTTTFGLESLQVNITHKSDKQLTLKLQSPDGKTILLSQNQLGVNYHATFTANAADTFIDTHFPKEGYVYKGDYPGNYRPRMDLSLLNNNQDPNGTWNLIVSDNQVNVKGKVTSVTLTFSAQPAKPLVTKSNLPIIKIYTNGQEIPDEPKIVADMYIIHNLLGQDNNNDTSTYQYRGKIGIEIRGNSSQTLPKLQYGFETRDAAGVNSIDASLLGFPKKDDWILSAVMTDKSLMRNVLTYEMWREMGRYASRTKFVELFINEEYRGVFIFEEKIKRDANRVNVEKIATTDVTPPNVTGGYIFSVDGIDTPAVTWQTKIRPKFKPFQFVYPKAVDVQPAQLNYLQGFTDSFEAALHANNFQHPVTNQGWREFGNDSSFIDYFILSEVGKNLDSYRFSTYFYKKRNGKIYAGPAWDFDRAYRNDANCSMDLTTGYVYLLSNGCTSGGLGDGNRNVPWWWARFLQDNQYKADMICRYNTLRATTLSETNLFHIIDSAALVLDSGGQQRNFLRWKILGKFIDNNPYPLQPTFADEVATMKSWITDRLAWLDNDLGLCTPSPIAKVTEKARLITVNDPRFNKVYPSPFKDHFTVNINLQNNQSLNIRLVDVNGKAVYAKASTLLKGNHTIEINSLGKLKTGLYFLQISGQNINLTKKVLKQ